MRVWHLTPDAPRSPHRVSTGELVALHIGTWPIKSSQSVWVTYRVEHPNGAIEQRRLEAVWQRNEGVNSYWHADIGPFSRGDLVIYTARGRPPEGEAVGPTNSFRVGPKLYLAILWHQHQPVYKDTSHPTQKGSYIHPCVRLHAIRDYYSMAALVAEHPGVHLTINLTPALLWQIEDYVEHDAEVETVTFAEHLEGNPARGIASHPLERQAKVYDLFTGSWIDENGSAPGVDLGTWIGEDQESGNDDEFDDLFRMHLKNVYRGLGVQSPAELDHHIVPHAVVWTFTQQVAHIQPGDRLTVRTNCPGVLTWQLDRGERQAAEMVPAGGVMAGLYRYHLTLGPFSERVVEVRFTFRRTCQGCDGRDICCEARTYTVHNQAP